MQGVVEEIKRAEESPYDGVCCSFFSDGRVKSRVKVHRQRARKNRGSSSDGGVEEFVHVCSYGVDA